MRTIPEPLETIVSRETMDSLESYVSLIHKWNGKINLVSKSQLDDLWQRHIWDSMQIALHLPDQSDHVDLGSGGGFPGIVLAAASTPDRSFHLVESDRRKSAFLRTVIRELELNAHVHDQRHEQLVPFGARSLTARALHSLDALLGAAEHHLAPDGVCVFPKGATWQKEVADAQQNWAFQLEVIPSMTEPKAALLKIKDIQRV